jgi:hypothetical protein
LSKIINFIRKLSPILAANSLRKTPKTNPSFSLKGRQQTGSANVPNSIENKQINRLGFMVGEGRVPDDFNTMSAMKIENLFLNGR